MNHPVPARYNGLAAFITLLDKEILRFRKIALQTIVAPILMGILYLAVFGQVMGERMPTFSGVPYTHFLVPGLVMMTLLQNSFSNSASSLLQSKIMGSIVFVQLPPYSGWQLALAFILASVVRGLVVGGGVLAAGLAFASPPMGNPLWILVFGSLGAFLMASLGVMCGLWADKPDQMGAFQSFVIMPLTFLSGVFYSVQSLPAAWARLSFANPFFYMIDGFRYGFFGKSDFDPWLSLGIVGSASVIFTCVATALFVRGYKLVR